MKLGSDLPSYSHRPLTPRSRKAKAWHDHMKKCSKCFDFKALHQGAECPIGKRLRHAKNNAILGRMPA